MQLVIWFMYSFQSLSVMIMKDSLLLHWKERYISMWLLQGYREILSSFNIVCKDRDHVAIPQNIMYVHYYIMLMLVYRK